MRMDANPTVLVASKIVFLKKFSLLQIKFLRYVKLKS